ncbi:LmbU family transcriptional regulator [Nonomuraea sp. NPDC005650]|uniref:LmbU family transcriptional regulator n=1 Tax=Nonomuraea sp. NPDC005650 TaxID=3157045 RepID=UPI00339E5EBD
MMLNGDATSQSFPSKGSGARLRPSDRCRRARESLVGKAGLDSSVQARRLGLRLSMDMSFESWRKIGDQLSVIADSSTWWLGDWLDYGAEYFPDRYRIALTKTSLSYKTLRNYAWVARKFPMSRRRDPEDEQEIWLTRAETGGWPQSKLRKEIQASRAHAEDGGQARVTISVEVSSAQEQRWTAAARSAAVPLPEWIAGTLDEAAVRTGR